jgi:hypothetical protein
MLSRDGRRLLVADYALGLVAVDLASGAARPLPFPRATTTLLGVDGLTRQGDALLAIQNGVAPQRVLRLRLDPGESRVEAVEVLESNHAEFDEPTNGVAVGGDFYFVGNSQWGAFDGPKVREGKRPRPPVVLRLRP